jgi:hypothetical protein
MVVKALFAVAAISAALAFAAPPALACTCMPFTKPDYARQATLVFTGTVTSVDVRGGPLVRSSMNPVDVVFDVETVYKGAPTKTVVVHTVASDASCGYYFEAGHRYTVFPRLQDGKLQAGLCLGNVDGGIDPQSYLLGSGYPPGADPPQTLRMLVTAGAVLAALGLIAVARLRKRGSPLGPRHGGRAGDSLTSPPGA